MAVKVITGYKDPEWNQYEKLFYDNFEPDDWDYMVIGDTADEVDSIAYRLEVFDRKMKQIGDKFYAVTYHS